MRLVAKLIGLAGHVLRAVDEDLPLQFGTLVREVGGFSFWVFGTVVDEDYPKLLGLRGSADLALRLGDVDRSAALARELLTIAERYSSDWDYGNAIHHGHLILGRIALRHGDRAAAAQELFAAGRTPGSPQLNSFGPNMVLAKALLAAGERDVVLQYFDLCSKFWTVDRNPLTTWTEQVKAGQVPDFGANLIY